jgi:hypothetical protein
MKNRILIAAFIVVMLCATAAQTSASLVEERQRHVTAPYCDPDDRVFLKADEAMAESSRQRIAWEAWLNSEQCYNEWVAEGRPTMPPYYEIETWMYTDDDGEVWMYFTPYPTPPPRYKPTTSQHETPAVGSLMVLSIIGMVAILRKRNRI